MQPRTPLPVSVPTLIRQQAGVISHAQLRTSGLGDAAIRRITGPWTRLVRGLYLTTEPTWNTAVWAGVLHGGATGAAGGATAAHLHGAVRDAPRRVTIWSTSPKESFAVGPWEVELRRAYRPRHGTPWRTGLEPALLDMANRSGEMETIAAVSRALAQGLTTSAPIHRQMNDRRGVRHSAVIRHLCQTAGIESVLEWLFLRDVIHAHGLPEPERQRLTDAGRVDNWYDQYSLLVELDGLRDHTDGSRDMFRDNHHVLTQRRTLRYGFHAVARERCRAASQVADGLRLGGWTGTMSGCSAASGPADRCQTLT